GSWLPYKVTFEDKHKLSETEEKTQEYDQIAFRYLYMIAVPLLGAYAVYSLLYETHKSWYSFVITTLVGSVYAYGFLMMVPSLYINYRLKDLQSVAHMPAKAMTYKFLNTFIDDLFAFTIKMPTLHRLATLRDDVIFFVYLYQAWAYKVDHTRVNEFGQGGEDEPVEGKLASKPTTAPPDANDSAAAKVTGSDKGTAKKRNPQGPQESFLDDIDTCLGTIFEHQADIYDHLCKVCPELLIPIFYPGPFFAPISGFTMIEKEEMEQIMDEQFKDLGIPLYKVPKDKDAKLKMFASIMEAHKAMQEAPESSKDGGSRKAIDVKAAMKKLTLAIESKAAEKMAEAAKKTSKDAAGSKKGVEFNDGDDLATSFKKIDKLTELGGARGILIPKWSEEDAAGASKKVAGLRNNEQVTADDSGEEIDSAEFFNKLLMMPDITHWTPDLAKLAMQYDKFRVMVEESMTRSQKAEKVGRGYGAWLEKFKEKRAEQEEFKPKKATHEKGIACQKKIIADLSGPLAALYAQHVHQHTEMVEQRDASVASFTSRLVSARLLKATTVYSTPKRGHERWWSIVMLRTQEYLQHGSWLAWQIGYEKELERVIEHYRAGTNKRLSAYKNLMEEWDKHRHAMWALAKEVAGQEKKCGVEQRIMKVMATVEEINCLWVENQEKDYQWAYDSVVSRIKEEVRMQKEEGKGKGKENA
ncbi:MAG: hypothetical protein Q9218_007856, partial [Villophora microphyllina]